MYETILPRFPPQTAQPFCEVSLTFGRTADETHLALKSGDPDLTAPLAKFYHPFRDAGLEYLGGRFGHLSISVPAVDEDPVRIHIAVPWVTFEDLEAFRGVASRQDFDRLMDIGQTILREMVEARILEPRLAAAQILAEPIDPDGVLYAAEVQPMGEAVGISWLTSRQGGREHPIFRDFAVWDPERAEWR